MQQTTIKSWREMATPNIPIQNHIWINTGGEFRTWLEPRIKEVESDTQNVIKVQVNIVKNKSLSGSETGDLPSEPRSKFILARFDLQNLLVYGSTFVLLFSFLSLASSACIIMTRHPETAVSGNFLQTVVHHSLVTLREFFENLESMVKPSKAEAVNFKSTPPPPSPQQKISWDEATQEFLSFLKTIKEKYPSTQNSYGRSQLYSAVTSTMTEEEPGKPACVVFLIPPSVSPSFTSCYVQKIGQGINSEFEKVLGDGGKTGGKGVKEINLNYWWEMESVSGIHEDLNGYLEKGKVVIVKDLDKLNELSELHTLHTYCDNAAPPDRRANMFFPIRVDSELYERVEWKDEDGEKIAKGILKSAWTVMDEEKRGAVVDRVVGTSVLLYPGDECELNGE